MDKFKPIILQNRDGTSVFRTDLVEIEFHVDGEINTRQFDLNSGVPVLPFRMRGRVSAGLEDTRRLFVVDDFGHAWVERIADEQMHPVSEMVLFAVLSQDDPITARKYAKLLATLSGSEDVDA